MLPNPNARNVTVAVATKNRRDGLERCLAAVLDGRASPAEIVVVDQSTDETTQRLVTAGVWQSTVPVRYMRQARHGLAASRNAAVALATQPIVAFTDDDCVPDARWLERIAAGFESPERPDAVTGRVLPLGPARPGWYAMSTRSSTERVVYHGRAVPWIVGTGGNTAVRREWLQRIGGFDERLGAGSPGMSAEDMDLLYRLLRAGATVLYEPAAVVLHERQSGARRLASRPAYGFGMGAFCAFCARRHDAYALWMLSRWCFDRGNALVRACVRCRWQRVREELLMVRGVSRGVTYGLRLGLHE